MQSLEKLPISREGIALFAENMKADILEGRVDLKALLYQKKVIEMALEAVFKDEAVKKECIDTIEQYGKQGAGYAGAKIEVSGRKEWDYTKTGDSKIEELLSRQEQIKKEVATRQKFLQTIPSKGMADPETGEIIYPASYKQNDFIKVTIK